MCSKWYKDIASYLLYLQFPPILDKSKYRCLKLEAMNFFISNDNLYWKDPGGMLLLCLTEEKTANIIDEFHVGICGGHHAWRATAYKILRARLYWPKLFSEVNVTSVNFLLVNKNFLLFL